MNAGTDLRAALVMLALVGCSDSSDTGGTGGASGDWEVAPIEDQTVVRNTLTPRVVAVDLRLIGDAPAAFTVAITSDDEAVVADQTAECVSNPCNIELTPSAATTAEVTVTLEASEGSQSREASLVLRVVPLLVTDRTDDDPAAPGSLRAMLEEAVDGDVVGFDTSGQFSEPRVITLSGPFVLDASVTVEGPGRERLTLDGRDEHQIFDVVSSSELTLTDVTLTRGSAEEGGAVAVAPLGSLRAERCQLVGNQATRGGAVFADGASVELVDCILRANAATKGGAVFVQAGTLAVDRTTFGGEGFEDPNTAVENGGAIAASDESTVTIADSSFEQNIAGGVGGAVSASTESCEIDASSFSGNRGDGSALSHAGTVLTVSECSFDGDSGSGPVIHTRHDQLTLRDSEFRNHGGNSIIDLSGPVSVLERLTISDGGVNRGAISVGGIATIEDIEISRIRSQDGGAAIYVEGSATVRRAVLVDNEVLSDEPFDGEGGAIRVLGDLTLEDSELRDNRAFCGGGLSLGFPVSSAVIRNTVIRDNVADQSGGGVFMRGELTLTEDSKVVGNTALLGGGLYVEEDADLVMSESQIGGGGSDEGNEATLGGGLLNLGDVSLDAVLVNANHATDDGGGVLQLDPSGADPATLTLGSTAFVINTAGRFGGGILAGGGTVTGSGNNFTGNTAGTNGGAIYVSGGDVTGVMASFSLNDPNDVAP